LAVAAAGADGGRQSFFILSLSLSPLGERERAAPLGATGFGRRKITIKSGKERTAADLRRIFGHD
jgi:hypothetical protein